MSSLAAAVLFAAYNDISMAGVEYDYTPMRLPQDVNALTRTR
jgi:hypothetical protein